MSEALGWQLTRNFGHSLRFMRLICGTFRRFSLLRQLVPLHAAGLKAGFNPAKLALITGELSGNSNALPLVGAPESRGSSRSRPGTGPYAEVSKRVLWPRETVYALGLNSTSLQETALGDFESNWTPRRGWWYLSPRIGKLASGVAASGNLELSGKGVVKNGRPAGMAKFVWSQGSLRNKAEGWMLDGITLQGDISLDTADLAAMNSSTPWELSVGTISSNRFGARNLLFAHTSTKTARYPCCWHGSNSRAENVTVDPSTVSLFPPVLDFNVRIDRVGLQDLVALVPGSVSDAKGRIDGVVRLGWSRTAGMQIGAGKFELRDDEVATLRLDGGSGVS